MAGANGSSVALSAAAAGEAEAEATAIDAEAARGGAAGVLERAAVLAEAGEVQAALPLLRQAVALDPGSAAAQEMLAQACMEVGEDEAAHAAASAAVKLAPAWPEAQLTLGRAALNSGRLRAAAAALAAYLAVRPGDAEVAAELAEVKDLEEQAIGRQVGLPGLRLQQRRGASAGPAGATWEAGALLAWYLVHACGTCATRGSACSCSSTACGPVSASAASGAVSAATVALRDARVLELGAGGTGIAGLAAACLGAHVLATDLPEVLPQLQGNLECNAAMVAAAGGSIAAAALDWSALPQEALTLACAGWRPGSTDNSSADTPCDLQQGGYQPQQTSLQPHHHQQEQQRPSFPFGWLVGADLVYSLAPVPGLVATVAAAAALAAAQGTHLAVLISHKHRHENVDEALLGGLRGAGMAMRALLRDPGTRCTVYGNDAAAGLLGCHGGS